MRAVSQLFRIQQPAVNVQQKVPFMSRKINQRKHVPLRPDTFPLLPLWRPHRVRCDAEIGLQQKAHAKVLVHEVDGRAVRVDVAAGLYVSSENSEVWEIISVSVLTLIPMDSNRRSFTLPTPGILRIERSRMKDMMLERSKGR